MTDPDSERPTWVETVAIPVAVPTLCIAVPMYLARKQGWTVITVLLVALWAVGLAFSWSRRGH